MRWPTLGWIITTSVTGAVHGQFTNLHDFSGAADGATPVSLTLSGSTFYVTAYSGGENGVGTLGSYDTTPSAFAHLQDFSSTADELL